MNESFPITTNNNTMVDKLTQNHPQLSEKAIVDYINGLEVINDQISFNRQIINSDSFLNKILYSITGKNQQHQLRINQNVATSLEVISVWLQEIECYKIDNDIVITHLTNKLSETRHGVMRLQRKHLELAEKVIEIDNCVMQLQNKINLEFTKLNERVHRAEAKIHVDLVFTKWKKELWLNYPPLVSLYLSIDELFWGDFGIYCRHSADSKKVIEMIDYLRNGVLEIIEDKIGIKRHELFDLSEWLNPIFNLPNEESEMLLYLCDWSDFKTAPITWSIQSYASTYTPPHVHKEIPKVLSPNRLFERLIDEQNQRAKFNDNH